MPSCAGAAMYVNWHDVYSAVSCLAEMEAPSSLVSLMLRAARMSNRLVDRL